MLENDMLSEAENPSPFVMKSTVRPFVQNPATLPEVDTSHAAHNIWELGRIVSYLVTDANGHPDSYIHPHNWQDLLNHKESLLELVQKLQEVRGEL